MGERMKRNLADMLTGVRISGSILLAFLPAFSAPFYAVYLICGLSDMLDGAIARWTNSAGAFGARLDTAADLLFAAVSFAKLLPYVMLSKRLWIWTAAIALLKACNIGLGFLKSQKLVCVHSRMNQAAGLLLFLLPLTMRVIALQYSAVIVCAIATVSAIQEGYFIGIGRTIVTGQERKANHAD